MMASLLKHLDLFGTKFHFYFEKENSHRSVLGSIFTMISITLFVLLFLFIGKEIFNREKPHIRSYFFTNESSSSVNLSAMNITIAIKLDIQGEENSYIDLNGGYFWGTTIYESIKDQKFFHQSRVQQMIQLKQCSKLLNSPLNLLSLDYHCIEFPSEDLLSRNTATNEEYFFRFIINNCNQNTISKDEDIKCNEISDLKSKFKPYKTSIYSLTIVYPILYNRNDINEEKDSLMKVEYEAETFPFDYNLQRSDTLFFYNTIITEDEGYFVEHKHNESYWTINSHHSDFQYVSDEDLSLENTSSILYELKLKISLNSFHTSRSYTKVQEIFPIVLAIMQIVIVIFKAITTFINRCFIDYYVLNQLFDTGIVKTNEAIHVSPYFTNNNFSKINLLNIQKGKDYSFNHCSNPKKEEKIISLNFPTKQVINKCFALRRSVGHCLFTCRESNSLVTYDYANDIAKKKIDLSHYLTMVSDVLVMQKCIFNEIQQSLLSMLRKVSIYDRKEVDEYYDITKNSNEQDTIIKHANYFFSLDDKTKWSNKNTFLYDRLDESYKSKIIGKSVI